MNTKKKLIIEPPQLVGSNSTKPTSPCPNQTQMSRHDHLRWSCGRRGGATRFCCRCCRRAPTSPLTRSAGIKSCIARFGATENHCICYHVGGLFHFLTNSSPFLHSSADEEGRVMTSSKLLSPSHLQKASNALVKSLLCRSLSVTKASVAQ